MSDAKKEHERPAEELEAMEDLIAARMPAITMDELRGACVVAGMGTAESWAKTPNRLMRHNAVRQARATGSLQKLYEAVDRLATQNEKGAR